MKDNLRCGDLASLCLDATIAIGSFDVASNEEVIFSLPLVHTSIPLEVNFSLPLEVNFFFTVAVASNEEVIFSSRL